jgi:BolA protein
MWKIILKRKLKVEKIIMSYFKPYFFSVIDVSEQHRGHQNFKENVESHFEIIIVSEKFHYKNKIDRHRMVNQSLKQEFLSGLHSVIIKTYTIDEYKYI